MLSKSRGNLETGYLYNIHLGGRRVQAGLELSVVRKQQPLRVIFVVTKGPHLCLILGVIYFCW